jgi:hypothetical protein
MGPVVNVLSGDFFFFFLQYRFELKTYTLSLLCQPFIVMSFFKIGSLKLFAQAGFKL